MIKKKLSGILTLVLVSAFILTACFSEDAVEDEADGAFLLSGGTKQEEAAEGEETEEEGEDSAELLAANSYVTPIVYDIDLNNLGDISLPASFESRNFNLEAGELTFILWSVDYYAASAINMLQIGDILSYDGREIKVELIEDKSGSLHINGGFAKGGCSLWPTEENTYVAKGENDYPSYTQLGTVTLPISDAIKVSDSLNNPGKPEEVDREGLAAYIAKLEENSKGTIFDNYNTTIEIKNGKIAAITRIAQ